MIRLFRTLLFILVAFGAGVVYERSLQAEKCQDKGARFVDGVCYEGS